MKQCTRVIAFSAYLVGGVAFVTQRFSTPTHPSLNSLVRLEKRPTTRESSSDKWSVLCATPQEANEEQEEEEEEEAMCWNPKLRKTLGAVATLGVLETSYLTWTKLVANGQTFCGMDCASVLNGPYATIPGLGIPLATLGVVAYGTVAWLALSPLVLKSDNDDDDDNRIWLTAVSTTMGIFSVFLMSLLFGVLKESCSFCVLSAVLSISLAKLSWIGGVPPANKLKEGLQYSLGGGLTALVGALVLFMGAPDDASQVNYAGTLVGGRGAADSAPSTLLASATASTNTSPSTKDPPPILTSSSTRALQVSTDLAALDAKMYGAYWCSHCYEQKELLGKEAMSRIPYIECSKDGTNSQTSLCHEKNIPGYPTWEVNGKLFPGEQELDELAEIVQQAK